METTERISRIQQMPVVAFEEGARLGKVYDVYIDRKSKRIQGVSFRDGIWSREKAAYVDLGNIRRIGRDLIIVSGLAAVGTPDEQMTGNTMRNLKGVKITTDQGVYIGHVDDLTINRSDGTIAEIVLDDHRALPVESQDIVLGPDVVVVPSAYVERIRTFEAAKTGLFTQRIDPAAVSGAVRDKYEELKSSVKGSKGTTEKVFDRFKSGSERARETMLNTSQKIQEAIDQIVKRRSSEGAADKEDAAEYQGAEAEHAGRTYHEAEASDAPQAASQGLEEETAGGARPETGVSADKERK